VKSHSKRVKILPLHFQSGSIFTLLTLKNLESRLRNQRPKALTVFCKVISKNESIENENETKKFDPDDLDTENQGAEHPYDEYLSVIS